MTQLRTHFEINRAAEYFDKKELQAQTGQASAKFADVILKELADNALDACETANLLPEIGMYQSEHEGRLILAVLDNGHGIEAGLVEKTLNFATRTSDKAAYRSPTRGAQGNALKTIIGIAHIFQGHVVISSKGLKHTITAKITPAGTVDIQHEKTEIEPHPGTHVIVEMNNQLKVDVNEWAYALSLFNPHSNVKTGYFENTDLARLIRQADHADNAISYSRTTEGFKKIKPNDPTSAHWYTEPEFLKLIYLHGVQTEQTVNQFVRTFHGLTSTHKAKIICGSLGGRLVSGIKENNATNGLLFHDMQEESRIIKPAAMGIIGEHHFLTRLNTRTQIFRHWYKKSETLLEGKPYLFEILIAEVESNGAFFHGVNHSATFNDFIQNSLMLAGEINGYSISDLLANAYVDIENQHIVIVHLVSPVLEFLDRGKTKLSLPEQVLADISTAIWKAAKVSYQEGKKQERDAAKHTRDRATALLKILMDKPPSKREVVFDVLPESIRLATSDEQYPANVRNVYYKARALSQKQGIAELDYGYFSSLLIEYWQENGRHPLIYNDPRGLLYHPHDNLELQLGTFQVRDYQIPEHQFNKLLYIEKKGLWPTIEASNIHKKYDLAVIAGEGYSSQAIRELLAMANSDERFTIFCLHDADPDGYNILRTLQEATKTMPNHSIEVLEVGLTIEQSEKLGLASETFTRKKALPEKLDLSDKARQYFEGRIAGYNKTKTTPNQWICRRVELNALSAGELISLIEQAIIASGAEHKVIPPQDTINQNWQKSLGRSVKQYIVDWISEHFKLDDLHQKVMQAFNDYHACNDDDIREHLEENSLDTWHKAIDRDVDGVIDKQQDQIDSVLLRHLDNKAK